MINFNTTAFFDLFSKLKIIINSKIISPDLTKELTEFINYSFKYFKVIGKPENFGQNFIFPLLKFNNIMKDFSYDNNKKVIFIDSEYLNIWKIKDVDGVKKYVDDLVISEKDYSCLDTIKYFLTLTQSDLNLDRNMFSENQEKQFENTVREFKKLEKSDEYELGFVRFSQKGYFPDESNEIVIYKEKLSEMLEKVMLELSN